MKLEAHPFGKFYYHEPTDKVVCLVNPTGHSGCWIVHYQYLETFIVHEDQLRLALQNEIVKHYPKQK